MPTISKEDYIKTIYSFHLDGGYPVSTSRIAKKLEVSNPATSDMTKKLASQKFLKYFRYRGVTLTSKGEKLALKILRRHRLWELFLTSVLKMSWSDVHEEAEKLEHQTSDALADKLDDFLGNPQFDPHGAPIPQKNGGLPKTAGQVNLSEAVIGKQYKLSRVRDHNRELIEHLTDIGLLLNTKFQIVDKLNFDGTVIVKLKSGKHSLSFKVAEQLFICPEEENV